MTLLEAGRNRRTTRAAEPTRAKAGAARSVWIPRLLAIVVLFAAWWVLTTTVGDLVVPSPATVARELGDVWTHQRFLFNVGHTLLRVVLGMAGTLVLAVIVGVAMGLSRPLEKFFDVFVLLGRSIPGLAWALLSVMIVGINDAAPVLAIILAATPMVTVQMWEGTKSLDRDLLQMSSVFRFSRGARIRHVVLPAILPYIVSGAKLALTLSWQVVVLSELFGLSNGVGFEINQAFADFSIAGVMAWTFSFTAIMAFIEFAVLGPIERRLTTWRTVREQR